MVDHTLLFIVFVFLTVYIFIFLYFIFLYLVILLACYLYRFILLSLYCYVFIVFFLPFHLLYFSLFPFSLLRRREIPPTVALLVFSAFIGVIRPYAKKDKLVYHDKSLASKGPVVVPFPAVSMNSQRWSLLNLRRRNHHWIVHTWTTIQWRSIYVWLSAHGRRRRDCKKKHDGSTENSRFR